MNGEITYYNPKRGFGFIKGEDSEDYWFHISQININDPKVGDKITFITKKTAKGVQAQDIKVNTNG